MKNWEISFYFWNSKETSDFIVDNIELWLKENKKQMENMEELVINLDNWPEQRSNRTQFLNRLVDVAIKNNIKIQLAYYPPYHSKYNPIEHVFWTLEQYWNWIILDSTKKTIEVVKNTPCRKCSWSVICSWKKPVSVKLIDEVPLEGIKFMKNESQ